MPRPSSGVKSRRTNGFALKQTAATKNTRIAESVPVAHGTSSRLRRRLVAMAMVPCIERISAQRSIDPACPLQSAVNTYTEGMFWLICPAT